MVVATVGLGGGRSGATLTERATSGAGEEMAGGLWLARRGKMRGRRQQLSLLREMMEETGWLVGETESLC
jgi:hypothetical protein